MNSRHSLDSSRQRACVTQGHRQAIVQSVIVPIHLCQTENFANLLLPPAMPGESADQERLRYVLPLLVEVLSLQRLSNVPLGPDENFSPPQLQVRSSINRVT